jgi:hypothetical protein
MRIWHSAGKHAEAALDFRAERRGALGSIRHARHRILPLLIREQGDLVNPDIRDPAGPGAPLKPRPPDLDWLNSQPLRAMLELEPDRIAPRKHVAT